MAIDPTLVKSVARAYEYQNFVPAMDGVGLTDFGKNIAKRRELTRIKNDNIQKEVKSYLDNYPPDIPISKIPEKYRSDIQKFLFKQKKIYSDAVKARVNMTAGSDEYQEQTDIMNSTLQSVNNLKNQWNAFGQGKEENLGDIDNKIYSAGNNTDNIGLLSSVYTDKLDVSISDDGDLSFLTGEGQSFKLNDIEQPFLKAKKEADFIQGKMIDVYESGVKLDSESVNFLMKQIEGSMDNIDVVKSLALDNMIANVELYDGSEEIFQRLESDDDQVRTQAGQELRTQLLDKYRAVIISQSQRGYAAKNPRVPTAKESFDALALTNPEKYGNLLNALSNKDQAPAAGLQLQRNLNMQAFRNSNYYAEYDKETNQFFLYDKSEKEGFRDEGASYPATPQGIQEMLNEVDFSRR